MTQARQYLAKAEEFLEAAQDSVQSDRFIAATGNALHAAINAADAVCVHGPELVRPGKVTTRYWHYSVKPGRKAQNSPGTWLVFCR